MCRNIKTLHNFKPPATDEEIRASSVQFVRKLSGFTKPSKANEVAFNRAVDQVAQAAHELLESLVTNAPPRDRAVEAAKARARTAERFHSAVAESYKNSRLSLDFNRAPSTEKVMKAKYKRAAPYADDAMNLPERQNESAPPFGPEP